MSTGTDLGVRDLRKGDNDDWTAWPLLSLIG